MHERGAGSGGVERGAEVLELELAGVEEGGVPEPAVDVGLAHELHLGLELLAEDGDQLGDAVLAEDVGEHGGPAQPHGARPQRQQRQHVRAAPHPAVGVDLQLAEHLRVQAVHVEQDLGRRRHPVHLPPAVVRQVHGREAEVRAHLDVVRRLHALGHDRQVRQCPQPVQRLDGEGRAVGRLAAAGEAQGSVPYAVDARVVHG